MADKKLIFLDIDGTLTPAGSNVPPESALKAIRAAQEKGHKVFLCTGRNRGMLAPVLQYGFDGFIGSAGGFIVVDQKVIYDHPMDREQFELALNALHESGVFCTIEGRDRTFGDEDLGEFLKNTEGGNSEIERWRKALAEDLGIRPMKEYDGCDIYKIVFMCLQKEQLDKARSLVEKDFSFVFQTVAAHGCLNGELINRAFDKGRGILRVCDYLGVSVEDTYGFGDSMNDLEMINTVGFSVCMANGDPVVQSHSDYICPSVEEDGLAIAFKKLGL
ncbi:MAG: HAD family hydrolase [Firmicutes bacterium]|nr:HAD family hydrolase [Bacillota bacterium]